MGLFAWLKTQRQWHRDHVAAFAAVARTEADGLTTFQHQCIHALSSIVPRDSYERAPAYTAGEPDYLAAPLRETGIDVHVYSNEAALFGRNTKVWLEEWAFPTPEALVKALVAECASRAI